ncbi:MAG: SDR family oxidoreductase [Sphingobium sp.]
MTIEHEAPLALVTGGHRRLGGVISTALARQGYRLAVHGSHDVALDPALEQALSEADAVWHGFVADFELPDAAVRLMQEVADHFGRLPDLLVNSAAIFGQDRLETATSSELLRHYAVNCVAPVQLTRFLAEDSVSRNDRAVINILDQRLANPHGDQLSYTLAKQALAGFTKIAAKELAPKNIRVNAVAPGLTLATEDYTPDQVARNAAIMPLGRLPQPDQIAETVCFLAQATAVTGQVVAVDCGAHMQSYERDFMHL